MFQMTMLIQIGFLTAILNAGCTLAADNSDEGRPYEFGFTIDGQQHRHEKKDERGIIQGEFGFITADGIYHVTVYATDENGSFKILSMRNIRISAPLDGSPFKGEISPEAKKYLKQDNVVSSQPPQPQEPNPLSLSKSVPQQIVATTENTSHTEFTKHPSIKPACASCGLIINPKPETPKVPLSNPQQAAGIRNSPYAPNQYENTANIPPSNSFDNNKYSGQDQEDAMIKELIPQKEHISKIPITPAGQNVQHQTSEVSTAVSKKIDSYQSAVGPQATNYANLQNIPSDSGGGSNNNRETIGESRNTLPTPTSLQEPTKYKAGKEGNYQYSDQPNPDSKDIDENHKFVGQISKDIIDGDTLTSHVRNSDDKISTGGSVMTALKDLEYTEPNPLQLGEQPTNAVSTLPPVSVSEGVIQIGGNNKQNIQIKDKFPGMQDGLPAGIEENDITNLLYKFHYTIGFHGHHEKGFKNGTKIGGYFVNGRDGISRVVTYIADENGYRPKVKFINLGLESEDTPKAETEKTFGLKSFEFVWYPL